MAYGLVNDTTLQSMADGLRNTGIVPLTVKEYYTVDKITHATPNVINMETAEYDGWFDSYTETFSIPDASKMEVKLVKLSAPDVGGTGVGAIYVNGSAHTIWSSFYETEMFVDVVEGNTCSVQFVPWGGVSFFGAIIEVRGIDADGNYIEFQEFNELPNKLTPEEMAAAINSATVLPLDALTITGNAAYRFTSGGWDWFVDRFGNQVSTNNISKCTRMFDASYVSKIPFDINVQDCQDFSYMFNTMPALSTCPKIRGTIKWNTSTTFDSLLNSDQYLRDVEDLFLPEMLDGFSTVPVVSSYSCPRPLSFNMMSSLRRIPSWFNKFHLCETSSAFPSNSYGLYYYLVSNCVALDEFLDIPVWKCAAAQTSNMFNSYGSFRDTWRVKNITFETNTDGTPIVTQWKSQQIDLTQGVGYCSSGNAANIIKYNSGITADKNVRNDNDYQALKNDPDWFTENGAYGRYNHDSAVATINSLPDTSAYLATAGGTNTIKFNGVTGSKTDGGAINTLTEEEIAVATAKGWTVTLS